MPTEPARIVALLTAAMIATINVLALVLSWSSDLTAGLNLAMTAWVALAGEYVRSKVTPIP